MKRATKYDALSRDGFTARHLIVILEKHNGSARVKATKTKGMTQLITQIEVVEEWDELPAETD